MLIQNIKPNIVLVNPPSPFLIDQTAFPPLGLMYLASTLKKHEYEVKLIDLANKENNLRHELSNLDSACSNGSNGSNLFLITATTPQYYYAKQIKNILKELYPESLIVVGGPHASSKPYQSFSDGFDIVIKGEGEKAAVDLAKSASELSLNNINKGLWSYPQIADIDTIPYPDRDIVNINSYKYKLKTGYATTIITSRGCPYSCGFCSRDVWEDGTRFHSPEYVYTELKILKHKYKFNNFLFLDDSFTVNKSRSERLLDLIKPLNINFRCYINSNTSERILKKLYDAGCIEVGMGIESANQQILNTINKKAKVEDNLKVIKMCKKIGIETNLFIMIGLPGENLTTIMETKNFMEKALPDKFGFNIFVPYPGSPIYKNPERYDITLHEMPDEFAWAKGRQGEYQCFVSTSELSREQILDSFTKLFEYYTTLTNWRPGIDTQ